MIEQKLETIRDSINEIKTNLGLETTDSLQELVDTSESAVIPSGTVEITENGTVDVSNYASANVNVSGGMEIPKSVKEFKNVLDTFIDDVKLSLLNVKNTYLAETDENITLYSPLANAGYLIGKRTDNKIRVYWLDENEYLDNTASMSYFFSNGLYTRATYFYFNQESANNFSSNTANTSVYYKDFNTLEDALLGIKSSTTIYTSIQSNQAALTEVYYTNLNANKLNEYYQYTKLSSNETIEVIN